MAPNGESNNDKPRLPSEKPIRSLMTGMLATQVPNNKLEVEKRNPTASAGFNLMNEAMFLNMKSEGSYYG